MLRMLTVTIFAVATLLTGLHRATACDESAKRAQLTDPESAQSELLLARDDDSGDEMMITMTMMTTTMTTTMTIEGQ